MKQLLVKIQPTPDDRQEGCDAIFPGDLFSFSIGASVIGNGHLNDQVSCLERLAGKLHLNVKAVGSQGDVVEHLPTKDFIACFDVTERHVEEQVDQVGQDPVAEPMPEVDRSIGSEDR